MPQKATVRRVTTPPAWVALTPEARPLETLFPYARNARRHSPAQVAQIAASLREYGWTIPVLIREDGTIIAGHGRVMAAKELVANGRTDFENVPVVVARGWSEEQCRAYAIADNRLAENSEWDKELLALEVRDLEAAGHATAGLGFSETELRDVLRVLNKPGAFLDDMLGEDAAQAAEDAAAPKGSIALTMHMLPADRDAVVAFLGRVREARGLRTTADALVALAREEGAE